ncbi:MAG: enoyl-CoA hydratase/isomerase family protein [Dehalococcoidia bacterium]
MNDELVHLEIAAGVGTITLDSPSNRNALSSRLTADLERQVAAALNDERVRVVVLTGTGPVFCSGADLKEQRERNASGETSSVLGAVGGGLPAIFMRLWESPKPVIGRINGAARAGGLGLVAACDIAVGVDSATFGFSEVRLGVIPAIISVLCLRKLGESRCMELFLTGEPFNAGKAVEWGLLNASVPAAELDSAVGGYVANILKGGPLALAGAKQLVRRVPGLSLAEGFAWTAEESARYFASAEALEGMTAFAEKRPPRWAQQS